MNPQPGIQVEQAVLNKGRKDKFIMIFTVPDVMKNIISRNIRTDRFADLDAVQFSLYNCPVPDIKSNHIEVPYSGHVYHTSSYSRPAYEPLVINFAVDNEFNNYWLFWKWLSVLNDPMDSFYAGPKVSGEPDKHENDLPHGKYNFTTNLHVLGMDEYNNAKIRFDYYDCLITTLSKIGYNLRDPDEIDCTCTMTFNKFNVTLLDKEV